MGSSCFHPVSWPLESNKYNYARIWILDFSIQHLWLDQSLLRPLRTVCTPHPGETHPEGGCALQSVWPQGVIWGVKDLAPFTGRIFLCYNNYRKRTQKFLGLSPTSA